MDHTLASKAHWPTTMPGIHGISNPAPAGSEDRKDGKLKQSLMEATAVPWLSQWPATGHPEAFP